MCHRCTRSLTSSTNPPYPLYMCGVVVSNVYSHSHLARALCCRSQRAIHDVPEMMQHQATTKATTFALHHPKIGHSPLEISRTEQRNMSRNKLSLNWTSGDNGFELIDSTTGRVSNGDVSRISKLSLFRDFISCRSDDHSSAILSNHTYKQHKVNSTEYQRVKRLWTDAMRRTFKTSWRGKPSEVEEFMCKVISWEPAILPFSK